MQWNTSPYQVSIFVHGHSKRLHAHEKSLIVVINDPLVPLPDDPPLHVILRRKRTNNTSQGRSWCESAEVQAWNLAHLFIVGYAMYALPDLPLGRDRFVWVWDHLLWAAKQYEQQSCSQLEAKTLPCWKDDSGGTPLICTYLKTHLYQI